MKKSEHELTLIVDIDEVLRRIIPTILRIYNNEHGTRIVEDDIKEWELNKTFPQIKNNEEFFKKHADQIFYESKSEDYTIELLNELHDNHKIVLASSQFNGLEHLTDKWLVKNKVRFDDLIYAHDKSKIKGDIMLDDGIHNLMSSSCNYEVCMNRPWNSNFDGLRVYSMVHFYNFVKMVDNHKKNGFYEKN